MKSFNFNISARLLNKSENALNNHEYKSAVKALKKFDQETKDCALPMYILTRRLYIVVEVFYQLGQFSKALAEIKKNLKFLDDCSKFHFLIKAGQLEMLANNNMSGKYFLESLRLAEDLEYNHMIAEAYFNISNMFCFKYDGLSLDFLHYAEVLYRKIRDCFGVSFCEIMISFTYWRIFKQTNTVSFLNEAQRLISTQQEEYFCHNQLVLLHFKYIRAIVLYDKSSLDCLLDDNIDIFNTNFLPNKCKYEEIIIRICIENNDFEKAAKFILYYENDVKKLHRNNKGMLEFEAEINLFKELIERRESIPYDDFDCAKDKSKNVVNLFDILNNCSIDENNDGLIVNRITSGIFPTYKGEGKFSVIRMPDGHSRLYPCANSLNALYRGQSRYYDITQPSLYRLYGEDKAEARQFVERIRYEELKRCIASYPLVNIYQQLTYPLPYPSNARIDLNLAVDALALAQHYGIKTELIDLTTDKFVAAFFATTECKNDVYKPITDNRKQLGVFYKFINIVDDSYEESRVRAVGLQPFSRPGEQKGLVYEMKPDENFNINNNVTKKLFIHDSQIASFIFNYMNRGKKLFPESPLESHIKAILCSKELSKEAFSMAKEEFYPNVSDDKLYSYLKELNISIVDDKDFSFSDEEKQQCLVSWKRDEDKFFSRLIVMLAAI